MSEINEATNEFITEDGLDDTSRALAVITRIKSISPIAGADRIELVTFTTNGWQCIAGKGEFTVGVLCVFFEIDAFLPKEDRYAVLEGRSNKVMKGREGYRIKSIKLKQVLSQGFAMPLSTKNFPELYQNNVNRNVDIEEGADVTEILGVKLYQAPVLGGFGFNIGKCAGGFPTHLVPKTDEPRIQSLKQQDIFRFLSHPFAITEKVDGTSSTYIHHISQTCDLDGSTQDVHKFYVCSRNLSIKEPCEETITYNRPVADEQDEAKILRTDPESLWTRPDGTKMVRCYKKEKRDSVYWDIAYKYHIKERLEKYCTKNNVSLAIQGEILGPGIQKNKYNLKEAELRVFAIYNINEHTYLNYEQMQETLDKINLLADDNVPTLVLVPCIGINRISPSFALIQQVTQGISNTEGDKLYWDWDRFCMFIIDVVTKQLIERADGESVLASTMREGLVYKSMHDPTHCRFKVISNKFLLKNDL